MNTQPDDAVGLLVVTSNSRNKRMGAVTASPIYTKAKSVPSVETELGHLDVGGLMTLGVGSLVEELGKLSGDDHSRADQALSDLLLLPELCAIPPHPVKMLPAGEYPRWGQTYYAEPALNGQVKRWLVVSHDQYNRTSGRALCVRTTSNTALVGPEIVFIQRGLAMAVCTDVTSKPHADFDLDGQPIPQIQSEERVIVARGLMNYLMLHRTEN